MLSPTAVAEILRGSFVGWNHLDSPNDDAVIGATCQNPTLDARRRTPHAQITDALNTYRDTMGIVREPTSTLPTPMSVFYQQLYNGGRGAFSGRASGTPKLLVPVAIEIEAPSGDIKLCELSSYLSKTPHYFELQTKITTLLVDRLDECGGTLSSHYETGSLAYAACSHPSAKQDIRTRLQSPTAFEYLIERRGRQPTNKMTSLIIEAMRCSSVHNQLYADAGSTHRDKLSRQMAIGALGKSISDIMQYVP